MQDPSITAGPLLQDSDTTFPLTVGQVLGRRRRVSDSSERARQWQLAFISHLTSQDGQRKKRRHQSTRMRPEAEGSSANGAPRSYTNGSSSAPVHKVALSDLPNTSSRPSTVTNGSGVTNGHNIDRLKSSYFGHDREEVARILLQALYDLGYDKSALVLSQESGFELENPTVAEFRNAIIQGNWTVAEELLFGRSSDPTRLGLALRDGVDNNEMRFWLRQQKYLELLEKRDTGGALMVLRLELTPLYQNTGKLHFLSRYILLYPLVQHISIFLT